MKGKCWAAALDLSSLKAETSVVQILGRLEPGPRPPTTPGGTKPVPVQVLESASPDLFQPGTREMQAFGCAGTWGWTAWAAA